MSEERPLDQRPAMRPTPATPTPQGSPSTPPSGPKKPIYLRTWFIVVVVVVVIGVIGMAFGLGKKPDSSTASQPDKPAAVQTTTPKPTSTPTKATPTAASSLAPGTDPRIAQAEKAVVDALPDAPIWEGLTVKGVVVNDTQVCVDRYYGPGGGISVGPGGSAGYVVVTFPAISLGKPQDGECKGYAPAPPTSTTPVEHDRECGSKVVLDSAEFVCAEDFDPWPLTVKDGILRCEEGFGSPYPVTFEDADGNTYAVNGTAKSRTDLPDVAAIWADNPGNPGAKIDIGGLINAGLALCP